MLTGEEHASLEAGDESFASLNPSLQNSTRKKKNKMMKRRFSDEQIRSLETMFESESKLEPRQKLQMARELGLQPRQVAIWFQNKRARWKSKQLERDYNILQANYTNLAARFEALKKDKQALTLQVQKLNDLIQKPQEQQQTPCCRQDGVEQNCDHGESSYNGDITNNTKSESEVKPSLSLERTENGLGGVLSDGDSSIKAEYFGLDDEEPDLLNMVEPADGSLTSSDNWGSFGTDGLFDESSSSTQWWDFWS